MVYSRGKVAGCLRFRSSCISRRQTRSVTVATSKEQSRYVIEKTWSKLDRRGSAKSHRLRARIDISWPNDESLLLEEVAGFHDAGELAAILRG